MTILEYEEKFFYKEEIEIFAFLFDGPKGGPLFGKNLLQVMRAQACSGLDDESMIDDFIVLEWEDNNQTYVFNGKIKFEKHGIYHLCVKKCIPVDDLGIHDESYNRRYYIKRVIAENAKCEPLEKFKEYCEKPFYLETSMGTFELDREDRIFDGSIDWNGEEVAIVLESDKKNSETATKAIRVLEKYCKDKIGIDKTNKEFATEKLLDKANEWREEDSNGVYPDEITKEDFMDRISLYEIYIDSSGRTYFWYDADEMFTEHAIAIAVLANGKYKEATIE